MRLTKRRLAFASLTIALSAAFVTFQNCAHYGATPSTYFSVDAGTSYCDTHATDAACLSTSPSVCRFNGKIYRDGDSTQAFANSTATNGQCLSETRTCASGVLSGSYPYAMCSSGYAACLFNGVTIPNGHAATAYSASTPPDGAVCAAISQTRTCRNGVLDGSYAYGSCLANGTNASCLFNGLTIAHGASVTAYPVSTVAAGQTCTPVTRTCFNGALSGAGNFASCAVASPTACVFNGQTVPSGSSVNAYPTSSVAAGQTCSPEVRACSNGVLSGSATFASCSVNAAASCIFQGQTVPNGSSVTAYANAVSNAAGTCAAESRTCTNGVLGGTASQSSCIKVGIYGKIPWTTDGSAGAVSYFQDPDDQTLFWGRISVTSDTWALGLFRANFATHTLTKFDDVFTGTPVTVEGRHVISAYDPTVAKYNGTKYVVFECYFPATELTPHESVATCGGPVDANNHLVTTQLRMFVQGKSVSQTSYVPSASVPKLVTAGARTFLGITQVQLDYTTNAFTRLVTRAMQFAPSAPLWPSDSTFPNTIFTSSATGTADLFDIKFMNGVYYFSGARGNNGCRIPQDVHNVPGCYHLEVGATSAIDADAAADGTPTPELTLPDNPQEYFRFAYDPAIGWGLLGHILKWDPPTPPATEPDYSYPPTALTLNDGMYFLPISNGGTFANFGVKTATPNCNPTTQVYPDWGNRNGACARSCGNIGGTEAYPDPCVNHGRRDVGTAYDTPYCCAP